VALAGTDRRSPSGFYSYDWFERATRTVHYVDGKHSATRIHPELQDVKVGDRIATGSIGTGFRIDAPVTVLERNHALAMGTWAFVLEPLPEHRTRLLVREPYPGWIRLIAPSRFGLLRALGGAIDYAVGEPLHFRHGAQDDARPQAAGGEGRQATHSGWPVQDGEGPMG
jgi:hypothetical protein